MRKIITFLIAIIYLIILICGCGSNSSKNINVDEISGKILFKEPMSDGTAISGSDFVVLDPFYSTITPIGFQGNKACFFGSADKILIQRELEDIQLFDVTTNEKHTVYTGEISSYDNISFVDSGHFSLADFDNIYVIDISDGNSKLLLNNAAGIHSWCKNGTVVYYNTSLNSTDKHGIYSYNILTDKKTYITDGHSPSVSQNGEILAYQKDNFLYVKDLISGKRWKYLHTPLYFCLSPDAKYVAVVEFWSGPGFYDGYTIKIWDYKNNIIQTVLPKYANGHCTGVDWSDQ